MMDLKTILQAVNQIADEKGIDPERVIGAIESSLAAAYRREYLDKGANVRAVLNRKTGEVLFIRSKEVVDESTVRLDVDDSGEQEEVVIDGEERLPHYNPERHILIDEARKEKKDVQLGEEIETVLPAQTDFGRIAAQNAKQVILQNLREAERESISDEFKDKEGKVVSGIVQRFERGNVYIDLGRTTVLCSPTNPSRENTTGLERDSASIS
jgi:N utilization substance protein A